MSFEYSFEKLKAWQLTRVLISWIYKITKNYPSEEKFGLVMQMRRAGISIASNLAEGSGRISFKDQAHFSQLSYGSLLELLTQLIISADLGYIDNNTLNEGRKQIEDISNKVSALRKSQLDKVKNDNSG